WGEGSEEVGGDRAKGQDSGENGCLQGAFSFLFRFLAFPPYPPQGTGSFCLLDRKVVDALNHFPERNRMTFGLVICAGFRQTQVEYNRLARHAGTSKWTVRRKIRHAVDVIVTFSSFSDPLDIDNRFRDRCAKLCLHSLPGAQHNHLCSRAGRMDQHYRHRSYAGWRATHGTRRAWGIPLARL